MQTNTPRVLRTSLKLSVLAGAAMSLSGCLVAMPPAFQVASLALDGFSYATTGKSVTDHAISTVTAKDCAMLRGLQGDNICAEEQPQLALNADGTPAEQGVIMADDVAATIKPADEDPIFQDFAANARQNGDTAAKPKLEEILAATQAKTAPTDLNIDTAAGPTE